MKKLLMLACLIMLQSQYSNAALVGKLNLSPTVQPAVFRELHDGQWNFGMTHPDVWSLQPTQPITLLGITFYNPGDQIIHLGFFQCFNAESSNGSFGPIGGINIPVPLSPWIQTVGDSVGLHTLFGIPAILSSAISADFFGGYRPIHSDDVIGNWTYGYALELKIAFGAKELQVGSGLPPTN